MTKLTQAVVCAGTPKLRLELVKSSRLPFVAETTCIQCGRPLLVKFGIVAAVFRIGTEFLGVCCDACLTPDSKERLHARRRMTSAREEA